MIYLSNTIWSFEKWKWWMIVISSSVFSIFGFIGVVSMVAAYLLGESVGYLYTAIITIPTLLILFRVMLLSFKKDVKEQFIN